MREIDTPKYRKIYSLRLQIFFFTILLIACSTVPTQTLTTHTGSLIPYRDSNRLFGYMDEETGEIVIKAQYYSASPFIGGFAIVDYEQTPKIINQNNDKMNVGKFDAAYLYSSENGKTVITVLENVIKKTRIAPPWWWPLLLFGEGHITGEKTIFKQRLINLTTGETIIRKKEQLIHNDIEVIGEYFSIDRKLYRFLDNGSVQCVADDENDATQAIAILKDYFKHRGINAHVEDRWGIRIDYGPYVNEKYANPDFTGAFEKLSPDFNIPFERSDGLYRDPRKYLNTSIEINGDRRYLMSFRREEPYAHAEGIYNETRKEWELKPYLFSNNVQYIIYDIKQTNNLHIFELHMDKIPRDPIFHSYTVINTISEKSLRYKVFDTNAKNLYFPFKGGVYYYIDLSQD